MNKIKFISISALLFTSSIGISYAGCVGPVIMGKCVSNVEIPGYNSSSNTDSKPKYEGASGSQYQYDLNKPTSFSLFLRQLWRVSWG